MSKKGSVQVTNIEDNSIAVPGRIRSERRLTEDGYVEEMLLKEDVIPVAIEAKEKEVKAALERTAEFQRRAQEAYDAIEYLCREMKVPTDEYMEFMRSALARVRDQKLALAAETRQLMNSLREVREFFLEDKHEEEVHRLLEFVELCERLKRLKDSGFLDVVAETMLRLTEK